MLKLRFLDAAGFVNNLKR